MEFLKRLALGVIVTGAIIFGRVWETVESPEIERIIVVKTLPDAVSDRHADFSAVAAEWLMRSCTVHIGSVGHGSGILLDPNHVVTARHCVDSGEPLVCEFPLGRTFNVVEVWEGETDCAILRLDRPVVSESFELAFDAKVEFGEEVAILGSPLIMEHVASFGHVTGFHVQEDFWNVPLFVVDAWAAPGYSGGGVINKEGQLIGLLVGGPNHVGAGLCWVLPVDCIRVLQNGIEEDQRRSEANQ